MTEHWVLFLTLIVIASCLMAVQPKDIFNDEIHKEKLTIHGLKDGKYLNHFEFTTSASKQNLEQRNYDLFPFQFGEILRHFKIKHLKLTITQGRYLYDSWGQAVDPSPVGAEMFVSFENNTDPIHYKAFVNAFAGLTCASLNFFDITKESYMSGTVTQMMDGYYGLLPQEAVCTENLTPFKNLLPTRGKSGVARLLKPLKLYQTPYHSMQIQYSSNTLYQSVITVYDPKVHLHRYKGVALNDIFGEPIQGSILSKESSLVVDMTQVAEEGSKYTIYPKDAFKMNDHHYSTVLSAEKPLNLKISFDKESIIPTSIKLSPVVAHRYQTGSGLVEGAFTVRIQNRNIDDDMYIQYMELIPKKFRVFFHKMKMTLNGKLISLPLDFSIHAGSHIGAPNKITFSLILPSNSSLVLYYSYEKEFLTFTDRPPDADRGFDLPSSLLAYAPADELHLDPTLMQFLGLNDAAPTPLHRVYTESILASFPTPDFSMPFNVIIISTALISMFASQVFTQTLKPYDKSSVSISDDNDEEK